MAAAMQTARDEGQKLQQDMINIMRGDVPAPSRVGGVMYNMGYYVSVIEPELHTTFLEALLGVCKVFEQRSDTIRETVSFYAILVQMYPWFYIVIPNVNYVVK